MRVANASAEIGAVELAEISDALHHLCQPLTVLQCRLEMGRLVGTQESYRDAVMLGLGDCNRLLNAVVRMRDALRRAAGDSDRQSAEAPR